MECQECKRLKKRLREVKVELLLVKMNNAKAEDHSLDMVEYAEGLMKDYFKED